MAAAAGQQPRAALPEVAVSPALLQGCVERLRSSQLTFAMLLRAPSRLYAAQRARELHGQLLKCLAPLQAVAAARRLPPPGIVRGLRVSRERDGWRVACELIVCPDLQAELLERLDACGGLWVPSGAPGHPRVWWSVHRHDGRPLREQPLHLQAQGLPPGIAQCPAQLQELLAACLPGVRLGEVEALYDTAYTPPALRADRCVVPVLEGALPSAAEAFTVPVAGLCAVVFRRFDAVAYRARVNAARVAAAPRGACPAPAQDGRSPAAPARGNAPAGGVAGPRGGRRSGAGGAAGPSAPQRPAAPRAGGGRVSGSSPVAQRPRGSPAAPPGGSGPAAAAPAAAAASAPAAAAAAPPPAPDAPAAPAAGASAAPAAAAALAPADGAPVVGPAAAAAVTSAGGLSAAAVPAGVARRRPAAAGPRAAVRVGVGRATHRKKARHMAGVVEAALQAAGFTLGEELSDGMEEDYDGLLDELCDDECF